MPGRSRLAVVLTEEERSELESRAARYTLPHKQVQRAKLVLHAAQGLTNGEIGARLDINRRWSDAGEDASARSALRGSRTERGRVARAVSPPEVVARVKAVACEPPSEGAPLSRRSAADIHGLVVEREICAASASTIYAGSGRTRSSPGPTAPESSPPIPTSWPRHRSCSTSTRAASKVGYWTRASS
jgi:hypothetical protein